MARDQAVGARNWRSVLGHERQTRDSARTVVSTKTTVSFGIYCVAVIPPNLHSPFQGANAEAM